MSTVFDNKETEFDNIGPFEDEIDCAIIDDNDIIAAMKELEEEGPTAEEELYNEPIDTNIGYDDSIPETDMVAIDADEIIAAERDIAFDPFEDDELIDIATNNEELSDDDYQSEDDE